MKEQTVKCPKCNRIFAQGNTVALTNGKDCCNYCIDKKGDYSIELVDTIKKTSQN